MKQKKRTFSRLRLTALFTVIVFAIILITIVISFSGMVFLHRSGLLDTRHPLLPVFSFAVSCLIVGTFVAVIISRYPLKPLRAIMDATDQIAAGDYTTRVEIKGLDEFEQLGEKFNHMASELSSVELLRTDFINNFSHEFKTPIVSIRGFAKVLKRDDLTKEEKNEYLDTIISESERLTELATNVLYLSKIEQQTILSDKKEFNVSEQIRLCIALLDGKWAHKNVSFDFDSGERFIIAGEELLKQLWINLIDNAIKFSDNGGTVTIRIAETVDNYIFTICNRGKTIDKEVLPYIFDKFYQAEKSHTVVGNGLGLSIAKKIVMLHDGNITATSTEKEDTVFKVELPKRL